MKIEGKNAVLEALKSDITVDALLVLKGTNHSIISLAREQGVKVQFVDRIVLDKESADGRHQGFIAKVSEFKYCDIEDILSLADGRGEPPLIVVLDGIEDPHNFGGVLRSCECAGAHGVIIGKNRSVAVNDTVIKVSAGAAAHMKVARVTNITAAIAKLKENGFWAYCASQEGGDLYNESFSGKTAIVIGGEGKGVSRLVRESCDKTVGLKMRGQVNSLNASVACGIFVFEIARKLFAPAAK